jgi:hypothetical protein
MPLTGVPSAVVRKMASAPVAVIAGALGAYLFGLDDLVRRHATSDLSSAAFHTTWVRIAMASAVGGVLNGMSTPEAAAVPLAFAVGTLPLAAIWKFMQEKAGLKTEAGKFWEPDLYLVSGLTQDARDRLVQEQIDSVERLAYADPVRLLFRTNNEWNVFLDIVDQALLINYVGAKIASLRDCGVRGSIEMADLYERSPENENTKEEIEHAKQMFVLVGKALDIDVEAARNIGYTLSNDALVQFVWAQYDAVYPIDDDTEDDATEEEKASATKSVSVPGSVKTPGSVTVQKRSEGRTSKHELQP